MAAAEPCSSAAELAGSHTGLCQEMLRHQSSRGGTLGTEGEAPAAKAGQSVDRADRLQTRVGIGDEDTAETGIDIALGENLSPRGLQARLHTGQAAEPHQIKSARAKGAHSRWVIADRYIAHLDLETITEFIGQLTVETVESFRILIRNGPNLECGLRNNGQDQAPLAEQNGQQGNGPAFSRRHIAQEVFKDEIVS